MRETAGKACVLKALTLALLAAATTSCWTNQAKTAKSLPVEAPEKLVEPTPEHAFLQKEFLDESNSATSSEIGGYDFKNHTYPLPRGWQHADGKEITLKDGSLRTTRRKIGMDYVATRFFDATGDGEDEAAVILKIGTGGSAIPHLVYVYQWQDGAPDLIWYFRTGDRSDGGLKAIYGGDGGIVVELFGQDRYIFDHMETLPIVGDEEPLCCPTHFTRTQYRQSGGTFVLKGDRRTFSLEDEDAGPALNVGSKRLKEARDTRN